MYWSCPGLLLNGERCSPNKMPVPYEFFFGGYFQHVERRRLLIFFIVICEVMIISNEVIISGETEIVQRLIERRKYMGDIFFAEILVRLKTKTARSVINKRRGTVCILKANLQITYLFTDIPSQSNVGAVVCGINSGEIKFPVCFNIPFLISYFIAILSMQKKIIKRSRTAIKNSTEIFGGGAYLNKLLKIFWFGKLV